VVAIVNVLLAVLSIIFGWGYKKISSKIKKIKELLDEIDEALRDEKITKEEVKEIVQKAREIL